MRKILAFLIFSVFAVYLLTSCRPPELEGAYVDYNAKRIDSAIELAKEATDKYPDNAEAEKNCLKDSVSFMVKKVFLQKWCKALINH